MKGHGPSWPLLVAARMGGRAHRLYDWASGSVA